MKRLDSQFHVFAINQNGDFDLGCGDDLDVYAFGLKGRTHFSGYSCVASHPEANHTQHVHVFVRDPLVVVESA